MNKPKIEVILGSIRQNRAGKKVADWLMTVLRDNQNAEFELVDLLDYPMPLFADAVSNAYRQGKHENPNVQKWLDKINAADGYIIVTPEYNHSYSSVLKNAIDYGFKEWNDKPVGFVSYGGFAGGARAVEHLRTVVAELRMYDVRDHLLIPAVWAAFDENGKLLNNEEGQRVTANAIADSVAALAAKLKK